MIPITLAVLPEMPALIKALIDLFAAHPQLAPDQVNLAVAAAAASANAAAASADAKMAADQAAHPPIV